MTTHYTPSDAEIERTQAATGMDRMQAFYHCRAREAVLDKIERDHRAAVRSCLQKWAEFCAQTGQRGAQP